MGPVESAALSFCRDSINAELHEVVVTDLRGMQVYRARPRNRVIPTYSTLDAFDVVGLP
jgi:hypothetical protein